LLPIFLDGALRGHAPFRGIRSQDLIQLTRLNNHPVVVNSDLIKLVEQAPDTLLTLVNGDKIVVRESAQEVLERVVQFRRAVLQGMTFFPGSGSGVVVDVLSSERSLAEPSGDEK
jgi:flagellar protein FlbD